ncbi:MAG: tRNA preQ1(34) S-adenosylmethionine ribosyltransferase-isomerase QueA [Candidatus Portiera sp.]|nr:tRNA preQ1(34) S-adenosylmethionine ribosyltransferase-isomerase QueA [Portiera sp.]
MSKEYLEKSLLAIYDLGNYSYELPEELIAQEPLEHRDASKLLHVHPKNAGGKLEDAKIKELGKFMQSGDVLVLNNSRVMPMRVFGRKENLEQGHSSKGQGLQGGGKVEIMINSIRQDNKGLYKNWDLAEALIKSSRPLKQASRILIDAKAGIYFEVVGISRQGENKLYQLKSGGGESNQSIQDICMKYGVMPLPPYIKRSVTEADSERYQTVYAKESGSAAAPTAGLHFSKELLGELKQRGIIICELTLHVGIGTFSPIRSRDIRQHKMHPEFCSMTADTCSLLNQTRKNGSKIIAGGTTSLRTLESFWDRESNCFKAGDIWTDLFIYPGKDGQAKNIHSVDMLLTNFHQPSSSLLLLVCAFAGYEEVMTAYKHAIDRGYRFFSYGDACLFHLVT